MWKRFGLTVVACGVMLGVAGFADAGTVAVKNTHRSTVHRTIVKPHHKTVRHNTVRTTHQRNHVMTRKTSMQMNLARRGHRSGYRHRHHYNGYRMV